MHFGSPLFSTAVLIPIMDLIVYPTLRRFGINFSPIKKIFAGFMCGTAAMIAAAVTQHYIYQRSACGNYAATCEVEPFVESLNVWIQTPSESSCFTPSFGSLSIIVSDTPPFAAYVLIALSEIFASIVSLEYAYTKARFSPSCSHDVWLTRRVFLKRRPNRCARWSWLSACLRLPLPPLSARRSCPFRPTRISSGSKSIHTSYRPAPSGADSHLTATASWLCSLSSEVSPSSSRSAASTKRRTRSTGLLPASTTSTRRTSRRARTLREIVKSRSCLS